MYKSFYYFFLKIFNVLWSRFIHEVITNYNISNINFFRNQFFLEKGNDKISVGLFLFLKFLFNLLMHLLFERSKVRVIFLVGNWYFFGNNLQISLKKNSFFLIFFDQAFSSEKTSILIIFRVGFNYFGDKWVPNYIRMIKINNRYFI